MKLNYKKSGSGPPLVILHGLFGSLDNWFSIAKELVEHYTLYLVDQRNHGDSPHAEEWNYAVMVEDLKELIDDEGLEKIYLMGHSMGGKTVMKFAVTYPERVEKLIVADIAPRFYPIHHQTILEGLNSLNLNQIKSRKEADDQLAQYIPELGVRQFLLKSLTRDSEGFAWKIVVAVGVGVHGARVAPPARCGVGFRAGLQGLLRTRLFGTAVAVAVLHGVVAVAMKHDHRHRPLGLAARVGRRAGQVAHAHGAVAFHGRHGRRNVVCGGIGQARMGAHGGKQLGVGFAQHHRHGRAG